MKLIGTGRPTVTATVLDGEPTAAELNAIENEMPVVLAEVELLDAQIITLDRVPSELDERRIRRARNRVLAARRSLANRSTAGASGGAA